MFTLSFVPKLLQSFTYLVKQHFVTNVMPVVYTFSNISTSQNNNNKIFNQVYRTRLYFFVTMKEHTF